MESDSVSRPSGDHAATRDALAAVAAARCAAADRLVTPWWYHPVLGLLLGGLVVAYGAGGLVVRLAGLFGFLVGIWVLITAYRRVTNVWVWGHESGPAAVWAYLMGAVAGASMIAALVLDRMEARLGWTWGIAGVVLVLTTVLGRRYDTVLRAHLRGES